MVEHIIKQISDAYELYKCRNSSVMFNFIGAVGYGIMIKFCKKKEMSLFKSDFVAVIIDFIKAKLQDRHIVLYFLNRFKQREERFHSLIHYKNDDNILEKDLQKRLYLYLFDQGFELYNESDTANGKMDFHLTGRCSFISGTTPFIIEVKVMKSQSKADAKWLHQLEIYSKQTNKHTESMSCCLYRPRC